MDAAALCAGSANNGVIGSNTDSTTCVTPKEAVAIDKIWYGVTIDGSYDPDPPSDVRTGRTLGAKQLWWPNTRGSDLGGLIMGPGTDLPTLMMQDAGYASSHKFSYTSAAGRFVNSSTTVRDKCVQLGYADLAAAMGKSEALQPALGNPYTDDSDLSKVATSDERCWSITDWPKT